MLTLLDAYGVVVKSVTTCGEVWVVSHTDYRRAVRRASLRISSSRCHRTEERVEGFGLPDDAGKALRSHWPHLGRVPAVS